MNHSGFRINAKPGQRFYVGGHGFDSRGSWEMEQRVLEADENGEMRDIGTVAEVQAREKQAKAEKPPRL
jgi:hypothetical protein